MAENDDPTEHVVRKRGRRTRDVKAKAAEASKRFRKARKEAGVPTSHEVDTAIANAVVAQIYAVDRLHLAERTRAHLTSTVIRILRSDPKNAAANEAIERRIDALRNKPLPSLVSDALPAGNRLQD